MLLVSAPESDHLFRAGQNQTGAGALGRWTGTRAPL